MATFANPQVGYGQAQNAVPVLVQNPPNVAPQRPSMAQVLSVGSIRALGIVHIVCGAVILIGQVVALVIIDQIRYTAHEAGTGIWCGIFIVVCGILGCCAASFKNNCTVVAFLVFSVITLLTFSPIMIGITGGDLAERDRYCGHDWVGGNLASLCPNNYSGFVAVGVIMLLASLVDFGASIWSIASASMAISKSDGCACCGCACCQGAEPQQPVYVYLPQSQVAPGGPHVSTQYPGVVLPPPPAQAMPPPAYAPYPTPNFSSAPPPPPTATPPVNFSDNKWSGGAPGYKQF